jgi:hypothetical protein
LPSPRRLYAARSGPLVKKGLRVAGIRPDGTLIVHDGADTIAHGALVDHDEMLCKWKDVEA